jgi:hypothetical protein
MLRLIAGRSELLPLFARVRRDVAADQLLQRQSAFLTRHAASTISGKP